MLIMTINDKMMKAQVMMKFFLEKFRNPAQNLMNVFPFFQNETSDDEEQEQAENETQKPKKDKKMKKNKLIVRQVQSKTN